MTRWIGAAILAIGLTVGGSVAIAAAAATTLPTGVHATDASSTTDLSARRRVRHAGRYAYHPRYQPYYDDRPYDYRPYPYQLPVPFFLGFGFGSW